MKILADELLPLMENKYEKSERMSRCINKICSLWTDNDGTFEELKSFCLENFIADPKELAETTQKFAKHLDTIDGYTREIYKLVSEPLHLETGELKHIDHMFAEYNPMAHISEDFFKTKLAFLVILNYPVYSLDEKNSLGKKWSSEQWAQARLADRFSHRIPSDVIQKISQTSSKSETYISQYNICMDKIIVGERKNIFPQGLKLISHWGLRDYLKTLYKDSNGLEKQKIIEQILNRIIRQEIPAEVINNDKASWDPFTNKVCRDGNAIDAEAEQNVRYEHIISTFKSERMLDPWFKENPTAISRNFNLSLEISEDDVRKMFASVLNSNTVKKCAAYISQKLGRALQPIDIWYAGFKDASVLKEEELTSAIRKKYKNINDFQSGIYEILLKLGFAPDKAAYLSSNIVIDASRSAGHAMGAGGKGFKSHLRTRFDNGQIDYISYNTAMHELGHCVEQVFSLDGVPSTLMSGVPNTAFTEAFAFVFQARDQEVLGVAGNNREAGHLKTLHCLWHCFELCGVSLVCMDLWSHMYKNQEITAQELKEFILSKASEVWNKWYAPIFGEENSVLLAAYSHMINYGLYLPNYPIGEIIRCQIENHLKGKSLAEEMEKLCTQGCLTPNLWLEKGMGHALSTKFILEEAEIALEELALARIS